MSAFKLHKQESSGSTIDMVNNPPHYTSNGIQSIDVIEAFNLNFHLGNAIKYILRCKFKNNKRQDLEKAIWYLQREIDNIDKEVF